MAQQAIQSRARAKAVDHHEKYHGLPTLTGRSKKLVFSMARDKVLCDELDSVVGGSKLRKEGYIGLNGQKCSNQSNYEAWGFEVSVHLLRQRLLNKDGGR
ncbi:hypothetical protein POTOM_039735 [Populus tomentosa]|uniref:Uncharacterized protein n=1 Tax=Populus tomentosa TaxID=118781 RepID=A0A8X7YN15_POPTO|nr:hypothetical protein POTOM_039735 [Populus tomentosa]